jgi:hypothetical protein
MTQLRTQDARAIYEALWAKVVEAPEDPERHEKFINFAAGNNLAKWAVERYREAEKQGIVSAEAGDGFRKHVAERAAAVIFFRAPKEEPKKQGVLGRFAVYLLVSGLFSLLLAIVTRTTVWPGLLMIALGVLGLFTRTAR